MNGNSVAKEIEKQTGLKKSKATKKYAQETGRGNIAYAMRFAGYRYDGDFHVDKYLDQTYRVVCDSKDAKARKGEIESILKGLGLEINENMSNLDTVYFEIPREEGRWYGESGWYNKGPWNLHKIGDDYYLTNRDDENYNQKITAYSPYQAKYSADSYIEQYEKGRIMNSKNLNSSRKPIKSGISPEQNKFNYAYNDWFGHFQMNLDRVPQYLEGVKWCDANKGTSEYEQLCKEYNCYPVGDREKASFYNALKQVGAITSSKKQIKSSFDKTIFSKSPNDCRNEKIADIYFTVNGEPLELVFKMDSDWDRAYLNYIETGAMIEIPETDKNSPLYQVIENLIGKPFEFDDLTLTDVYAAHQIQSSHKPIKSGSIYDFNNCSWCGDEASGTLEYFLERDGYDVKVACDILDADPAEVVCEDCYKSIKPELDAKMYSEYDDLGIDIRTGEPFPYPDLNQSHKSLIQKRVAKSSKHILKSGYYNTDEHPEGGGTCDYCQTEIAPGDGYEKDFQSTRDTAVQKLYKALGGNDKYSYQVQTEGDLERWLRQADEEIDEDYVNDMINDVINTAFKNKDGYMCHDCLEASLMSAAEEWVEENW